MSLNLNLDSKYSALIDELTVLNQKFGAFINGAVTDTVQTDAGVVKSLSGIVADLKKFKYVQKIIDHKLYSDMLADDVNLEVGIIVRVWGDTDSNNGLYLKKATATYQKISYSDIYDLGGGGGGTNPPPTGDLDMGSVTDTNNTETIDMGTL